MDASHFKLHLEQTNLFDNQKTIERKICKAIDQIVVNMDLIVLKQLTYFNFSKVLMFVHLNIHSIYSPMKGLITLNRLMKLANYYNMNTLALTDVNECGVLLNMFNLYK